MIPVRQPLPGRTKLVIRSLHMTFRTEENDVRVLEDIALDVREGEFVCILGPSGCGKSTLLNIVAGFLAPTSGSVRIDGDEVRGPVPRRIFVFQVRGVFPWLTVEGNIGFGLGRLPPGERERRIAHYVRLVGLEGFEKAYPHELSGGMKQRVEESVQLADRVVVMTARPARIRRIVPIDLPHPRDLSSRRYLELRDGIFEEIGLAHKI